MTSVNPPRGFFRCPHCRQKTITAWTKLRTRGACPACEGRFVAGSWGIIPAVLALPVGMYAPMLVLHPSLFAAVWLMLAAGIMLGVALAAVIYLFTTPLYRKGSVGARWDAISFFTGVAALTIAAMMNTDFGREAGLESNDLASFRFGSSGPPVYDAERITSSVHYGDPAMQQALKDALDKAGIPYKLETREGKEMVGWTYANDPAARAVQKQLEGSGLATGRSVSFQNAGLQKEFIAWLAAKGVKHETTSAQGREYVVWEGPSDLAHQFMLQRPSDCGKTAAAGKGKCG
jgi:hypothetical protein